MAIAVEVSTEIPQQTTVGGLNIQRLGVYPMMTVTMVETVADFCTLTVEAMVLEDQDVPGVFSGVTIVSSVPVALDGLVGQSVTKPDATVVGVVASVESGPVKILFAETITEDLTGIVLTVQRKNTFGVDALRASRQGRSYDLILNSAIPAQLTRMQQVMGGAHMKAVLVVLAQLGISKTIEEVQAAVMSASDNLESLLATELEALELERRAGTFVGLATGNVPQ